MSFIVLIIAILSSFEWSNLVAEQPLSRPLPKTHITLNAQKGCAVHVAAWLSPSCTHCAEYFVKDIPEITSLPGFCMDLHFLPHLYLLDMPVAILIWSQSPNDVIKNAALFFNNQREWLEKSASREKMDDPRRISDIEEFLQELKSDPSKVKDIPRIKAYLTPEDPFLHVKIFALRHFNVEHLERYLPKNSVDQTLSTALLSNLPRKDDAVVKFGPAFTNLSGQLLPDSQLNNGILTPSAAKNLLNAAGPFVPKPVIPSTPPVTSKKVAKKASQAITADDDTQYADEDTPILKPPAASLRRPVPYKPRGNDAHTLQAPKQPSLYDDDFEEDTNEQNTEHNSTQELQNLDAILEALESLDDDSDEYTNHELVN